MFPLKIDEPLRRFPVMTITLVCVCCAVFIRQNTFFPENGFVPLDFVHSLLHPDARLLSSAGALIASFFLHAGLLHLIGNMWYLWIFGSALESVTGPVRFLVFYLFCGTAAMLVQVANNPLSTIPIVGASGAIAGTMGMYLILRPFSKIIFGVFPFISFRIPAFVFLLFWFWMQWKSIGVERQGTLVAWWAHTGGFICGMVVAVRLKKNFKERRNKRSAGKG